jgi:hypothetical protein
VRATVEEHIPHIPVETRDCQFGGGGRAGFDFQGVRVRHDRNVWAGTAGCQSWRDRPDRSRLGHQNRKEQ